MSVWTGAKYILSHSGRSLVAMTGLLRVKEQCSDGHSLQPSYEHKHTNSMPERQPDGDGEHDEEACYRCLLIKETTRDWRCGKYCRLLIEVLPEDAEREPKIEELRSPIYYPPEFTESGQRELAG